MEVEDKTITDNEVLAMFENLPPQYDDGTPGFVHEDDDELPWGYAPEELAYHRNWYNSTTQNKDNTPQTNADLIRDRIIHYVRSFIPPDRPMCNIKFWGHSTTNKNEVTCKACLKKMASTQNKEQS